MSWLRNHMRHFVVPGIRTIARADGRALTDQDIKDCDKILRPSNKCEYVEAGMIYALVSSILPKSNTTREVALGLCRQVGKPGDAEFVYELDLGGRGYGDRVKRLGDGYEGVEGADVLHSFIQNSVKELKARTKKNRLAIYPGRDVWCWEVMSKRQGMPSLYDSRVSRSIATNEKAIKKVIEPWQVPDWEKTLLFDTGHEGTVPRAIGRAAGLEQMMVIMLSAVRNEEQIFRTHAKSRKKALACEYLAKYRKRATVRDDAPYQELADLEEFIKAALLTIWLWYHVSPARLPAWRDDLEERPHKKKSDGNQLVIAPSNWQTPIWINTSSVTGASSNIVFGSSASTSGALTTTGADWGLTSAATTLDSMWGGGAGTQLLVDQIQDQKAEIERLKAHLDAQRMQKGKKVAPSVDPGTFNLIDPISKAPLDAAMDAKAQGLDPVQYEIQRSRQQAIDAAQKKLTGMQYSAKPINKNYVGQVNLANLDNSTSQPSQSPGGPGGGSAPAPTTRKGGLRVVQIPSVPLVSDGNGKAITG